MIHASGDVIPVLRMKLGRSRLVPINDTVVKGREGKANPDVS